MLMKNRKKARLPFDRPRTLSQYEINLLKEWEAGAVVGTYFDEDDNELIDTEWAGFPPGTHKEDVWHWFDDQFTHGLGETIFDWRRYQWINHPYVLKEPVNAN